ncbi:hypothetical protein ACFL6S_09520 [Candidatus Poribacteria bacterium]
MLRIKGIVKAFNEVRRQIKQGIPEEEADKFRSYVLNTVNTIEKICSEHHASPDELPHQSRNAYHFLKDLDLENLPILKNASPTPHKKQDSINIANVVKTCNAFICRLSEKAFVLAESADSLDRIHKQIQETVNRIDEICRKSGVSPSALNTPSRNAYCFMRFLVSGSHLKHHVKTLCRATKLINDMRPEHEKRQIVVQLTYMRHIYSAEKYGNAVLVKLSEGLIDADDETLKAIFRTIFHGKSQLDKGVINDYIESEGFCGALYEIDSMLDLDEYNSKGRAFDLNSVFKEINREYFNGDMQKPSLHWSRSHTIAKFGHYQPSRDRVMISVTLDDENVPSFVVEFVMYHELLHKKHGAQLKKGKRYVHTQSFREEEQEFKRFQESNTYLRRLAQKQRVISHRAS